MKKISIEQLQKMKAQEKIVMLTAYSYAHGVSLAEAQTDVILVGDSLGMVFQGRENTLAVTIDEMIYHAKAVRRGAPQSFMVVDMPFMSFQVSAEQTLINAGRIMKEANPNALKLEGASEVVLESIKKITAAGIPVMGHLGFTPQAVNALSGYKVQGKLPPEAEKIIAEAKMVEAAGAFALVLEMIPAVLAQKITDELKIPTISCGAGPHCDGQVLVIDDILNLSLRAPRFAKQFKDVRAEISAAVKDYAQEVKSGNFPDLAHSF